MTNFDPDAYLHGSDSSASFDPDAYLSQPATSSAPAPTMYDANLFRQRVGRDPEPAELANFKASKGVGWAGDPTQGKFTIGQATVGGVEDAISLASSVPAGIAAAPAYFYGLTGIGGTDSASAARATRRALTYQPRTEAGQAGLDTIGQIRPGEIVPRFLDVSGHPQAADVVRDVTERTTDVAPLLGETVAGFPTIRSVGRSLFSPIRDVEAPDPTGLNSRQSMGAARATYDIDNASPDLQRAVRQAAHDGGDAINSVALENHLEADQHGIQLMEGQATRDPAQFSAEQNSTHPAIVKRINEQNDQMIEAFDDIRRRVGSGSVDPIENGQTAVDSLKAYDEPILADINAKYDAARRASADGNLQMDGSSFVVDANKALKPQSKFRFLPGTVKGILDDVANADGKMTLDDFQAYETQLGNEIAKAKAAGDGNAAFAIGKVSEALQKVKPMGEETAQAKALFDTARAAAKARFDALDSDPAYRAAVDDVTLNGVKRGEPSALADKFLDRYALQAPKANVTRLMEKLDSEGQQAVASHTLGAIRQAAVSPNGVVSPHGFNKAIAKFGPKMDTLVSPETQESLESLGRVITNAKVAPPGHFVNYSKSGVIRNAATGTGQAIGEHMLNAKTFGMGVPVVKGIVENNFASRTLAPGAGLTRPAPRSP